MEGILNREYRGRWFQMLETHGGLNTSARHSGEQLLLQQLLIGRYCCATTQQHPKQNRKSQRSVWKIHAKACLWCHLWWLVKIWTCTSGMGKHRNTKAKNLNRRAGLVAKISQISVPRRRLGIWAWLALFLDGFRRGTDRSAFEQYANRIFWPVALSSFT